VPGTGVDATESGRASVRIADVEATPLLRGGELNGMACAITDVTDLATARDREQQLLVDRHMAMLASGLAHELANNLTALHGYSRMIDPSALSEIDRSSLAALQEETSAISETLDGFRRIVRPIEPVREAIALARLIDDALAIVGAERPLAPGAIVKAVPAGPHVLVDRVLLEEALAHIVRNAVEACRDAGVPVMVWLTAREDVERHEAVVMVRDRGPGVAEADRRRLFQPFFSTKPERAGFGLAYARHILLAHGGHVEAAHPDDGGLLVTLTLPLAESAAQAAPAR
jgi:signal transduction histidine kinase